MSALRLNLPLPLRLGHPAVLYTLAAVIAGVAVAALPLPAAAISLAVIALCVAALINPLVGVGAALILGPSKPATDYFIPQLPLDLGQLALLVTLFAWAVHHLRQREARLPHSPFNLLLISFTAVGALSLVNALSLGSGLTELIKWVQILLVMWLVIDQAGREHLPLITGLVLAAGALQAVIGLVQFGRGDGPEHFQILGGRFYRAYGTFEQPNPFGGFMGLTLALAVGLALMAFSAWAAQVIQPGRQISLLERARLMLNGHAVPLLGYGALAGLLLAGLLASWSRGSWLGFSVAGLALLMAWPRRWGWGLLLVIGALLAGGIALQLGLLPTALSNRLTGFTTDAQVSADVRGVDINDANYAVLERLAHWQAAREMARYNPLLGVGLGNYEVVYPAYALINWPQALGHAHNIYLNMLAETGVLGLGAYLLLWGVIIWRTWQIIRRLSDHFERGIALGLLGAWCHLSAHQFLDKLYVANLHFHIGAMLGMLSILLIIHNKR